MDAYKQKTTPHPQPAEPQDELPLKHAGEGNVLDDPVEDAASDSFPAEDLPRDHEGH